MSGDRVPVLLLLGLILGSAPASAQETKAAPRPARVETTPGLTSINPPSAPRGSTVEWSVVGRHLEKVDRWVVSGEGVAVVKTVPESDTRATVVVRVADDAPPGIREVRAVGPHGASNLALIRIDRLPEVQEHEPNDEPAEAQELAVGSAVSGVLKPQELDHFRFRGRSGQRLTIEVEAQRLGTPISPVLTVQVPDGPALAQATQSRGTERDSRLSVTLPADGEYLIQVRDALYGGGDQAIYRLRIDEAPYATALWPIGGRPGEVLKVTAEGGSLREPLTQTVTLPATPGAVVELSPFDSPNGPVIAPGRLLVGDGGHEVNEGPADGPPVVVEPGSTANGRIGRPGEVDRFAIPVKAGVPIGLRVRAADSGSWLDPVLTLHADGKILAEVDDLNQPANAPMQPQAQQQINQTSLAPDATDSRFEFTPEADGTLTVEVTDRYGDGGPEFGYRLEVGPPRPDFQITLLVDPSLNNRAQVVNGRRPRGNTPGITGSLSLRPGSTTPLNFLVVTEGDTGEVRVRAEGLPTGVAALPVTIKPRRVVTARGQNDRAAGPQTDSAALFLRADSDAEGELGEVRVIGEATRPDGTRIVRTATATINLETNPTTTAARAVTRLIDRLPVRVLGESRRPAEVALVGPPKPVALALTAVRASGALLQGGRVDLRLEFEPAKPPADSVKKVEAQASGKELAFQAVPGANPGGDGPALRVLAAVDAVPGPREVTVKVVVAGGVILTRTIELEVRPPIALNLADEPLSFAPGRTTTLRVKVRREPGYKGAVDLRLEGLPNGVRPAPGTRLSIGANEEEKALPLVMAADAPEPDGATALRVVGVARMPRGPVRVDSAVRPMLLSRPAEK